jgi:hypothetical protein
MSTPDDIAKLRQLKESEPLQHAWDEWVTARKVRLTSSLIARFLNIIHDSRLFKKHQNFSPTQTPPCER